MYPDRLEIVPLTKPPTATVHVPGSKSITNRALVLAALQSWMQDCTLAGALRSEDTEVMVEGLRQLGFRVNAEWPVVQVTQHEGELPVPARSAEIFVANSGTTMRFLTALCALGRGRYRLDGIPRMRERPIEDLLTALRGMGVKAYSEYGNGCPPVIVESDGCLHGPGTRVRGDISSQFLSALLMIAPFTNDTPLHIFVDGPLVSKPYIEMTLALMAHWGANWRLPTDGYEFSALDSLANFGGVDRYTIEPDASSASYFFASAAIASGRITVPNIPPKSLQGDVRFVDVLEEMGCTVVSDESGITVRGGPLHGIDVDMNDISDTVMTLAAVACFAEGPTTIRNVAHIRHKETDRLAALATELRRVGAEVTEFADGLTITPRPLHGAEIETYNDHRMAMSMALIGLRVPGIVIKNPGCVAKTYPHFFTDLERLRQEPREDPL
jgi:3-phosphoshikimate 1-carboxyvinyltransferase